MRTLRGSQTVTVLRPLQGRFVNCVGDPVAPLRSTPGYYFGRLRLSSSFTVGLLPRLPTTIKMDLDLFQGGHAFFDFFIDQGEKLLELLARVDYLDDNGQVLRQPFDLERVQPAVGSKTHHSAHHCGSGQTFFSRLQHQPFVQELAVVRVTLADENAQQVTF